MASARPPEFVINDVRDLLLMEVAGALAGARDASGKRGWSREAAAALARDAYLIVDALYEERGFRVGHRPRRGRDSDMIPGMDV